MAEQVGLAQPWNPATREGNPWIPLETRIAGIRKDLADVASYELAFTDSDVAKRYRFLPGQFNMLYLPGFGESAISISSDAEDRQTLTHTVRFVGNVTRALSRCERGDHVYLRGPFGSSWPVEECRGADLVIAAGGIGLAPLRPVLYHIINHREDFGRVCLLYGARTPASLLYREEMQEWKAARIEVLVTVDMAEDSWKGEIGVVPGLFGRIALRSDRTVVLTCGPEIMIRFVINEAITRGVAPERIFLSMERNMSCAMGFCGHCQLGPTFICRDGPVFSFPQMEPYLNLEDL
ncbi:MAG: FAD/NAD(P)-binding protein [Planctomycetales bacterium]|nr:FAD/NAD(P)-binding protein [Planctomycetales bacterium]